MITFVNDGESLFGTDFDVLYDFDEIELPHVIRESCCLSQDLRIEEFHYKSGYGLENPATWKNTHDDVGVATFENIDGKKFALRYDLLPSAPAKFGRAGFQSMFPNQKIRISIPYSEEIRKRKIEIEHIVGFLLTDSLISFVIVEIIPDAQKVFKISENIAFQMGKILSDTHKVGVIHGHPHLGNWVSVDGKPRLVDGKGVLLDVDFPWHTCTGRVRTFQDMAGNDCAHVLHGELGTNSENFDAFNDGYRTV